MLLGGVLDAAQVEVAVRPRLVDRRRRAQAHRDRRELPQVRREARVRVGRQAATRVGELLTETVELVLAEPTLEERAGIDARGGVTLEEDLVAPARVVLATEEVVEADLVERRDRRVGGDVPPDADAGTLRARHYDGGVPADPRTVLALERLVTGEVRLVVHADRVDVRRRELLRHRHGTLARPLEQAQQDVPGARAAAVVDEAVQGLDPLRGLRRVEVRYLAQQAVDQRAGLVVRSHSAPHSVVDVQGSMDPRLLRVSHSSRSACAASRDHCRSSRPGKSHRGVCSWPRPGLDARVKRLDDESRAHRPVALVTSTAPWWASVCPHRSVRTRPGDEL